MSVQSKETEVRRLLSRAWSLRRRKAALPTVQNSRHLDLNRDFEDRHDGNIKYFVLLLVVSLLVCAVSQIVGSE
jgi:hypothetical protein